MMAGGAAHAQQATTDKTTQQEQGTLLDRILVTTGKGTNPEDVPASVSKIDKKQLDTFGRDKIDDVLRSTPGTFTSTNPQQPGVAVNIRGFEGSGRVNSMIDGVRQNFRFTGHEAAGFTYVDPNFLAGIDIARGAVSTAGGGGLAGSVNFRTIGVDDVVREGQTYGLLGRMQGASNGGGFNGMTAAGMKNGSVGIVGGLGWHNSNDYKNGDGVTVPYTGQELKSGLAKVDFGLGEDQQLSLGGIIYHNDFLANSYFQTINNRTVTANYRYDPSGNDLVHLRVNGYYNSLDMDYSTNASGGGSAAGRNINDKGAGFDVSNTSLFNWGNVAVQSVYGVEYFHDDVTSTKGGVNPASGTSWTGGVFTENTFRYGNFDLIGGLRYDFYGLNGSANAGPTSIGQYTVDQSKGYLDPKITLAYNPVDWLQPYITYSRTMRAPTLQETMVGGDHPGGTSVSFEPNPSLMPETQQGWEIGLNLKRDSVLTAGDALRVKLDYFDMTVEDYIAARYNPAVGPFGRFQFMNIPGTTHQRGAELSANYDVGYAFAGLSYTHTETDLPSEQPGLGALSYLPDDILALTLGARFIEEKLTVGTRINYVSNGWTNVGNGTDSASTPINVQTDGYTLVDLFANYKFNDNVDLSFKVTNLFNKQYTPALTTYGSGQGRTFYASTQYQF
ncbi:MULTISPECIES: TonB-dependent receptor domain-containing protein [unclassified Mesorhizobium]|uniref:TonB-dependent receptor domain-containing protein n=1 Tax=unclassified Mesorhizobium TaxID=325217 RepID=UPI001FEF0557|nr:MULTISPECIES: TonB-dependent receptor [unclassified Mesorhizobium]